jgi:hypothetical protein
MSTVTGTGFRIRIRQSGSFEGFSILAPTYERAVQIAAIKCKQCAMIGYLTKLPEGENIADHAKEDGIYIVDSTVSYDPNNPPPKKRSMGDYAKLNTNGEDDANDLGPFFYPEREDSSVSPLVRRNHIGWRNLTIKANHNNSILDQDDGLGWIDHLSDDELGLDGDTF